MLLEGELMKENYETIEIDIDVYNFTGPSGRAPNAPQFCLCSERRYINVCRPIQYNWHWLSNRKEPLSRLVDITLTISLYSSHGLVTTGLDHTGVTGLPDALLAQHQLCTNSEM